MADDRPPKLCKCGRLATHYMVKFTLSGEPTNGKQLACDAFPSCKPVLKRKR